MAGHAAPLPSVITNKAARSNGNQRSRCRAAPDMITHQRQLPGRPPRRSEGPVTSRVAPRVPLAMPNDDDDMSAIADMSSAHGVDRAMPSFLYARFGARCARDPGGWRLRANFRALPVALVQHAENRLPLRRLERGRLRDDAPEAAGDRPSPALLMNRDRDLRPERILCTAGVAAYSSRDERIFPGSERASARKFPGRNRSRQSLPRAPVDEHPGLLVRPRAR